MRELLVSVLLGFGLLASQGASASIIVFDNLGPGDTYSTGGYYFGHIFDDDYVNACSFVPSQTGEFDEIWSGMFRNTSYANEFTLALHADAAGLPGAVLWTASLVDVLVDYPDVSHVADINGPTITAGVTYWLLASNPATTQDFHYWYMNNTNDIGRYAISNDGGATWGTVHDIHPRFALRVGIDDGQPVIPEPATLLLCLGGTLLLAVRHRDRR